MYLDWTGNTRRVPEWPVPRDSKEPVNVGTTALAARSQSKLIRRDIVMTRNNCAVNSETGRCVRILCGEL